MLPWTQMFSETLPQAIDALDEASVVTLGKSVSESESELSNDNPELCFILEGTAVVRGRRKRFELTAPAVVAIGENLHHQAFPATKGATVLWIYTAPDYVSCWLNRISPTGEEQPVEGFETLRMANGWRIAATLIDEAIDRKTAWMLRAKALLTQLAALCLRAVDDEDRFHLYVHNQQHPKDIVQRALYYINKYHRRQIGVPEVAESVGLSPNYLTNLFKQTHGMTVTQYVTNLRLQKAQTLLRETSDSVAEIAYSVGFHSPYYLSRVFKKEFGKTPREYRSEHRQFKI